MAITPTTDLAQAIRDACGENAYLCYQCQKCSVGCPTAHAMTYRPAQIMRAVQFGLHDLLVRDASIWRCLTCETCGTFCPNDLHPREVIEVLRCMAMEDGADLSHDRVLERGVRALRMLSDRIDEAHNISGDANDNRLIWAANLPEQPPNLDRKAGAETVYFVGCVSSLYPMSYAVPQAFVTVLEKAGVDYTTMGKEEWCCGYPLLIGGQVKAAEAVIRHNVEAVHELGAKRVVMTCPSCYHAWHHIYPEVVGDLGIEVVHAVEVMAELVKEGRLPMQGGREMVVTYHDPCDLGRKGGIYDAPRQVLRALPGVTFVEMDSRRETALCCGGGGNLETFDPDLGAEVAAKRLAEAQAVEAGVIASACPQCERTLTKATRAERVRIRVMDIAQLVESVLA
ncbi:MAG TPA: (Fe-S)-binding protein [Anaerolineae bacterium]|nr:(Fe-S)-binding protein [Anaerolineae bacterium]